MLATPVSQSSSPGEARLPSFLRPGAIDTLVRVGRDHDGGYLVDSRSIDEAQVLLSLGINEDWSFEKDFIARNKVPVYALDPTVGTKVFVERVLKAALRINRPSRLAHALRVLGGYRTFFAGKNRHVSKFAGLSGAPNAMNLGEMFRSLSIASGTKVFLKMDIEGSEYRLLDEIVANHLSFSGMVIEFHDADLHSELIREFVDAMPLSICHLHCNNVVPLAKDQMAPVIELTFTDRSVQETTPSLPHPLDMTNNPEKPEYAIAFV